MMTEWRVRVAGTGAWASGTWNFPFATEGEAREFAQANGGEVYLYDYGQRPEPPPQRATVSRPARHRQPQPGTLL